MDLGHYSSDNNGETSSYSLLIDRLKEKIEAHLTDAHFGVDSLASSVGMSRSSLHRKLHKAQGISTSKFIREYRLKRALIILQNENVTASEAAYRVGFGSATYFNTCFHKFYGFTPGEVKSRSKDEIEGLLQGASTATVKTGVKNRPLWIALLVTAMLSIAAYLYSTTSEENKPIKEIQVTTDEKSIAVMPLKNWTGNPDLEYVSDGMTDAIISRLTKINSIDRIIPFTSVLSFKATNKTISEIATELEVEKVLQGNLQIAGDHIKINLQLVDGYSNEHIWSEAYTRDWKTDEIFKIQTQVVESIAANMRAIITDNELTYVKNVPTRSKQAYSFYLQAKFERYKATKSTFTLAMPLYEKAIALDSNFVEAYLGLASMWNSGGMVWGIYDEQQAWGNAKELLEKALEIDPTNLEVEEELYTGYFYYDWDFERVESFYQTKSKSSFYGLTPVINTDYAIKTGRYQEAIKSVDKHLLRDPSFIDILFCFKAEALLFLGNRDDALDLLNGTAIPYSDNWFYLRESAKQYFYLGEYEQSKKQLHRLLSQFPDYPPILMWLNAVYAEMDDNPKKVNQHLEELRAKYHDGSSGSPAWFIALYYSHVKDYEKTFEWLQKSYDRHEVEMTWLREEPLLAPIRYDARYKNLYEKVGFSQIGLPIKATPGNLPL